jgi:hypothetical protein
LRARVRWAHLFATFGVMCQDYVAVAFAVSKNRAALKALRAELEDRRGRGGGLFDLRAWVRRMEVGLKMAAELKGVGVEMSIVVWM